MLTNLSCWADPWIYFLHQSSSIKFWLLITLSTVTHLHISNFHSTSSWECLQRCWSDATWYYCLVRQICHVKIDTMSHDEWEWVAPGVIVQGDCIQGDMEVQGVMFRLWQSNVCLSLPHIHHIQGTDHTHDCHNNTIWNTLSSTLLDLLSRSSLTVDILQQHNSDNI